MMLLLICVAVSLFWAAVAALCGMSAFGVGSVFAWAFFVGLLILAMCKVGRRKG
jgi:hypothetical protein